MSEVFTASGSININYQEAVNAFKKVDEEAKQTTKTLNNTSNTSKSWSNKFSSLGNKLSLGLTAPLMLAGKASFSAASDLNENLNKTDVVFKGNSATVENWSKNALKNMGMCQSSALEMASKFGDMGSAMGLNSKQTMDYSMNLTQLAADLASFKNISIEQANTALTGVYTGETESLKGLGYVMTQTNLQRFAESQGIHKKIQSMTQAEQVQLRYKYIMDKTTKAQGDFARTSDQAANVTRSFPEALKELEATIGNNLLPIFTPLINVLNGLIIKLSGMGKGTQQVIVYLGLFAVALGPTIKMLTTFGKSVNTTVKFIKNFPGNLKKCAD
ncbi:MAG: phage tail tape measure protein, partial [Paeniclostridium sp.]|nr:phage tail tape measure protein [Paeniclostridium sp.]